MILENIIRKFLFEDIRVTFKDAPRNVQDIARTGGGTAFRIKLVDTLNTPKIDDILNRIRSNTQFGQSSKYAKPDYTYILSADQRDNENKMVFDVIIIPTANAQKQYKPIPTSTAKIGQADVFQDEALNSNATNLGSRLKAAVNIVVNPANASTNSSDNISTKPGLTAVGTVSSPAPTTAATSTQTITNKPTGNIVVPQEGFKYGIRDNAELKKLQDLLKKNCVNDPDIKNKPVVKNFTRVQNMTGYYGPATQALIIYLKGGLKDSAGNYFKNRDGNVIEPDFVKLLFKNFKITESIREQFANFDIEQADIAVQKQNTQSPPANTDTQSNQVQPQTDTQTEPTPSPDTQKTLSNTPIKSILKHQYDLYQNKKNNVADFKIHKGSKIGYYPKTNSWFIYDPKTGAQYQYKVNSKYFIYKGGHKEYQNYDIDLKLKYFEKNNRLADFLDNPKSIQVLKTRNDKRKITPNQWQPAQSKKQTNTSKTKINLTNPTQVVPVRAGQFNPVKS
jgi:hypothetical protein